MPDDRRLSNSQNSTDERGKDVAYSGWLHKMNRKGKMQKRWFRCADGPSAVDADTATTSGRRRRRRPPLLPRPPLPPPLLLVVLLLLLLLLLTPPAAWRRA